MSDAERQQRRRALQSQALHWSRTCTPAQLRALHAAAPTQEYRSAVLLAQRLRADNPRELHAGLLDPALTGILHGPAPTGLKAEESDGT